jgi:hypothetical protein
MHFEIRSVNGQKMDIIDEAIAYFRVNVLFKNFELRGPADKVLVYLMVLLSHMFKVLENVYPFANSARKTKLRLRSWGKWFP